MDIHKKHHSLNISIYYKENKYLDFANMIISFLLNENKKNIKASFSLVKDDKAKVYYVSYDNENFYIKFYDQIRNNKIIKNIFRGPESLRYFKTANTLIKKNLKAVNPVLAIIKKDNILSEKSILVTKELNGKSVLNYLKNIQEKKKRTKVIYETAKLFAELINKGFIHQDPSPPNFWVLDNKRSIAMIDIDDVYYYPYIPKFIIVHMLARAQDRAIYDFSNSNSFLSRRERYLFIKTFVDKVNKNFDLKNLIKKVNIKTIKRF